MRYIAAYMLAQTAGKADPTDADVKTILSSVGIDCNAEQMKKVISELKGKNVDDLVAQGQKKLATVPSGAPAAAPAAAAASGGSAAAPAAKKEEKKKEKPPSSESDEDIGMSLFG